MTTTHPLDTASTTSISEQASAFAAQVRASLNYIAPEELDDLLDGLGAEIEERLADGGELGDPAQYAEELRQAAGLQPRPEGSEAVPEPRRSPRETLADIRTRATGWLGDTPARRGLRDFLVTLRPVWWILRGIVLAAFVLFLLGYPLFGSFTVSLPALLLTLGFAVVSVQWGRGRWLPRTWLRRARTVASVLAIALLLPFGVWFMGAMPAGAVLMGTTNVVEVDNSAPGLTHNGRLIQNVFAYDCEGKLLDAVRLYDQEGNAISTNSWGNNPPEDFWDETLGENLYYYSNALAGPSETWYVFPLELARYDQYGSQGAPKPATPPYEQLSPLTMNCPVPNEEADSTNSAGDGMGSTSEGLESTGSPLTTP